MILDFDKMEEQVLPEFKGGLQELHARMFFDGLNRVMKGCLTPGSSIGRHVHDTSSEVIFVTGGRGHVLYDGDMLAVKAGMVHYCAKGHEHSLINDSDGDLEFWAVVPQQ